MLLAFLLAALTARASQLPLSSHSEPQGYHSRDQYYELPHDVKHVAVIGAGPNGLLQTAKLLEYGFHVRMFEKAPQPGGVWLYSEKTAIPASFE